MAKKHGTVRVVECYLDAMESIKEKNRDPNFLTLERYLVLTKNMSQLTIDRMKNDQQNKENLPLTC